MSAPHETLIIEATGETPGLLRPGRLLRALAEGLDIRADEVGAIEPMSRTGAEVEIRATRASRLVTPMEFTVQEGGNRVPWNLRRAEDDPLWGEVDLRLSWTTEIAPRPGALASALSEKASTSMGAEELDFALVGDRWAVLRLPALVASGLPRSGSLDVHGETVEFVITVDGKKNA